MNVSGKLQRIVDFESQFVRARHIEVWCPPGYADQARRYPVIYMQDGQNLFEPHASISGASWEMDTAMLRLMNAGVTAGAILVGIWNHGDIRWREYMPQKPYASNALRIHHEAFINRAGGEPVSDLYLRFVVEELKPWIDSHFRTLPEQPDTFVMGSSMGGLISLYAVSEYPQVFYGAGCLSTNWPAGEFALVHEMAGALPDPQNHKLYFDYGTQGLDALYEPFQMALDDYLRANGYTENTNWLTRKFEGADHNEIAWARRVEIPLSFFLASLK